MPSNPGCSGGFLLFVVPAGFTTALPVAFVAAPSASLCENPGLNGSHGNEYSVTPTTLTPEKPDDNVCPPKRRNGGVMKRKRITFVYLALLCFTFLDARSVKADPLELTGKDWMAYDGTIRGEFVLGYLNGLEQVLSMVGWSMRSRPTVNVTPQVISEALYKKLVQEPELRSGPLRESLWTVADNYIIITDRAGSALPNWQKLITASDCADVILRLMQPAKAENSF